MSDDTPTQSPIASALLKAFASPAEVVTAERLCAVLGVAFGTLAHGGTKTAPRTPAQTRVKGFSSVDTEWLSDVIAMAMHTATKDDHVRVKSLEQRVDALEATNAALVKSLDEVAARPALRYVGTWRRGTHYQRGDVITKGGGAWTCTDAHVARDQFDHQRFTLFVKAGRDRDAGIVNGRDHTHDG